MRTISSFLITVALIAGIVGCAPGPVQYDLTISITEGGELVTPSEATSTFVEGTTVALVVFPHTGYRFVNWTGDVDTIADVNAASTTITMNGDYEITANFEETPPITFAIAGPMTEIYGEHQWWGAELARDEINAGAGLNVGGICHRIELVQVDTNEMSGTPDEGITALQAVIDDVDFVVGGFKTENVAVYRDVAMEAKKIFMNCGAAPSFLQFSVVTDYDKYKCWFKAAPYNESFMVKSLLKMVSTVGGILKQTLTALEAGNPAYVKDEYKLSLAEGGRLRVHILREDEVWSTVMTAAAQYYLPRLGYTVTGKTLVSPTAADITTEVNAIKALNPHIIFTMLSGSVGAVYSTTKADLGIPAMTIGINVEGEQKSHWANTDGKCNGEIMLDDWAEGLQNTAKTTVFFNEFVAKTGEYPIYTAGTYDAIYSLKEAIEAVSAAHSWDDITDVVDPANVDALIQYLETSSYTGVAGTSAHYSRPDIDLGGGVYALSDAQVRALYSSLATYNQTNWLCAVSGGPHIAHDLVYGPGYQTGIGSQWQDGHKVGVWPMDLGDASDAVLTDQYGCWNFEYPGTVDVMIPIEEFLAS